ncbi:MAG TPA: Rieske 2Fe-2S domain-containing protein, partial [Terriglobales bacterium]|nr:Rieske 2Fe-2S domain-containing protein [Terriglobales bacterium]
MLSREENELLTQVGRGTPMGDLLRRYWYPVAASSELIEKPTKAVRILGEDLVLYRDRQGRPGLIGPQCAHRRMSMLLGIPEQDGLRCPYHGWLYDRSGKCLEQPYEQAEDPDSTFKDRIRMPAYPVEELGGLIFAYLGPQPAPLLPRWELFMRDGVWRDIGAAIIPCNWLQIMENSLDPVHVEWLHQHFFNYVQERLGRGEIKGNPVRHKKINFREFEYGIIKTRMLEGESEDNEDWQVGHPVLFPNILLSGSTSRPTFQIRVPMDDTHTLHLWYTCYPRDDQAPQEVVPFYNVPVPSIDGSGEPQWSLLDNNSGEDIIAWITQGGVADRTQESLGLSDKGIILYRRQLKEQLEKTRAGQ